MSKHYQHLCTMNVEQPDGSLQTAIIYARKSRLRELVRLSRESRKGEKADDTLLIVTPKFK